jgi:hypothetical protein
MNARKRSSNGQRGSVAELATLNSPPHHRIFDLSRFMKKVKWFVLIAVILLIAAAVWAARTVPIRNGVGRFESSPDKKFTAFAQSMAEERIWGRTRNYYDFMIQKGSGPADPVVRRIEIAEPAEGLINWREEGLIEWAPDSSEVTFVFSDTRLSLKVPKSKSAN